MSNTEALRAAAQAVLDRWDSPQWAWTKHGPTADLMHALREAMAQPAETDADLQRRTGEPHIDGWPLYSGLPPPAQPAASGEPVAWRWAPSKAWPSDYVMTSLKDRADSAKKHGIEVTPLYAAQPAPAPAVPGKLGLSMVCPYCEQGFTAVQEPQPAPALVPQPKPMVLRDWCTDPDNCTRCKAPQWDQHRHSHAGIPLSGTPAKEAP